MSATVRICVVVAVIALAIAACSDGARRKQFRVNKSGKHPVHEHAHGAHPHQPDAHHHHAHPHPHLDGPNGHHHPY